MSSDAIPNDPYERASWVRRRLAQRGLTLSAIARRLGISQQAVSQGLLIPSAEVETAIADAIEVPVASLFRERFLPDGTRKHRIRKHIARRRAGKVEKRRRRGQSRRAIDATSAGDAAR